MMAYSTGETSTGSPRPLRVTEDGQLVTVESATPRRPLYATLTVTDAAPVQLSTALPDGGAVSAAEWILVVPSGGAAVRLGKATVTTSTGLPVAAGAREPIRSSTLAGWYAIAESGSVTVRLVGAADVS